MLPFVIKTIALSIFEWLFYTGFTVYIEGSQVIFSKKYCFCFFVNHFVLANSADPDEMLQYAAFHLGLHCLPKYQGFLVCKGLRAWLRHGMYCYGIQ